MPVLSKPKYVEGPCNELAHPWQPSCILANKEFMTTCLVESFKLYTMFYTVSKSVCACSSTSSPLPLPPATHSQLYSISPILSLCLLPFSHSSSLSISSQSPLPVCPITHSLFPIFIQLTALTKRKGLKHFIVHSIPAVLRSTLFLSLNGGPLLFWICLLR